MSASDIQIITIIVPNPQYDRSKSARIVDSSISYTLKISNNLQTISSTNPNSFDSIEGLVYVPLLDSSINTGVCAEALSILPANVTTINSFPINQNYPLTAVFPWTTNEDCTLAYLAQARADAVRGVITFQPGTGSLSASTVWNLRGSLAWRSDNQFPIYGVDGGTGAKVLDEMDLYSGNMTTVPFGQQLAQQYDVRDYPRLFAHVDLSGGTTVPSLWIFLIIVLAILLGVVILASLVMHVIQRHQRRALQRRVQRGEVDLESLGIKRMNVPQEQIDKMPRYTYTDSVAPALPAPTATRSGIAEQPHATSFSQTTCAVCLDDFISKESDVRELPCKHIYHPECIDLFLRDNSSLCPICKQSALPAGFCPVQVTNLMVRRERLVRRMRERRIAQNAANAALAAGRDPYPPSNASAWVQRTLRLGRGMPRTAAPAATVEAPSAPAEQAVPPRTAPDLRGEDVELNRIDTLLAREQDTTTERISTRRQTIAIPTDIAAQGASARRAWRRERLARQEEEAYNQQAETARNADVGRPLWRRVVGRVAPGLE